MLTKRCKFCGGIFIANKYRPAKQYACSLVNCQYLRQLDNMETWRKKHPIYFKRAITSSMKGVTNRYLVKGIAVYKAEYLKAYRLSHKKKHREYMKVYMRERRKKNILEKVSL